MSGDVLPFKKRLSPIEQRVAEIAEALADWQPPTSKGINNPHLINVRVAYLFVIRPSETFPELVNEFGPEHLAVWLDGMTTTAEYLAGMAQLCTLAVERVLKSGAADGET